MTVPDNPCEDVQTINLYSDIGSVPCDSNVDFSFTFHRIACIFSCSIRFDDVSYNTFHVLMHISSVVIILCGRIRSIAKFN